MDKFAEFNVAARELVSAPPAAAKGLVAQPLAADLPPARRKLGGIVVVAVVAVVVVLALVVTLVPWRGSQDLEEPERYPIPVGVASPMLQWQRGYGGSGEDVFTAVAVTAGGDIVVAGYSDSADGDFPRGNQGQNAVVAMLDGQGELKWAKTFDGDGDDAFNSVALGEDGSIYVVGYAQNRVARGSRRDALAMKLTPGGELVWLLEMGGEGEDVFTHVVTWGDSLYVTGYTDSTDGDFPATHGGQDAVLACLSSNGALVWATTYGGSGDDSFTSAAVRRDSEIVTVGRSTSRDIDVRTAMFPGYNAMLALFEVDGPLIGSWFYGGNSDDEFNDVVITADNRIYLAGATASTNGHLGYANHLGVRAGFACTVELPSFQPDCSHIVPPTDVTMQAAVVLSQNQRATVGGSTGDVWSGEIILETDLSGGTAVAGGGESGSRYLAAAAMTDGRLLVVGSEMKNGNTDALVAVFTIK